MKYSMKYNSIEGELKILNKGNGFVINELADEEFFIKYNFLKGAMNGDRVRVSISTSRNGSFFRCRVEKIIKRKSKFFTAKIYKYKKQVFACIYPLQSKKIILKHLNKNFSTGDIVKIQIYPEKSNSMNLAFDITPARYVTGLITEKGICNASEEGLKNLFNG